jgi:hypothetical protein
MEISFDVGEQPKCTEDRAARQLVRRIRKLRWLGMDKEARRLEATISRMPLGEIVLLLPANTD